jgi:hypothetical protein
MTDRDRCRLHTTGRLAHRVGACLPDYHRLHDYFGGDSYGLDTPIGLDLICKVLGLHGALRALNCVLPEEEAERDRIARLFACECVERVLPLFEWERPDDRRPRETLAAARRFAAGEATEEELAAAKAAAEAAAEDVTFDTDYNAAYDVARAAAWAAAARDTAWAASYARADAGSAAWIADWATGTEYYAQQEIFLRLLR